VSDSTGYLVSCSKWEMGLPSASRIQTWAVARVGRLWSQLAPRKSASESVGVAVDAIRSCARTSLAEEEGYVANPKLQTATRGENPTGDDGDRHAGSESCVIVRLYTGDRDHEA
jgi:hypothetical protein